MLSEPIPWSQVETVVFDCGDTLAHVVPPVDELIGDVLSQLGFNFPSSRIQEAFAKADFVVKQRSSLQRTQHSKTKFFDEFNTTLAAALGIEHYSARFNEQLQRHIRASREWAPKPGASMLLEELAARHRLFVLANWEACLDELLADMGLAKYFEAIHTSEEMGIEKPEPEIFARFLSAADIDPSRALYVGNEYRADVVGSRRAGFMPVLVDPVWAETGGADCFVVATLDGLRLSAQLGGGSDD